MSGDHADDRPQKVTLVGGLQRIWAHPPAACAGTACCVHNPSKHHMSEFPQFWFDDTKSMARVCPHGVYHPDPDEVAFRQERSTLWQIGWHPCCGNKCCDPQIIDGQIVEIAGELE